MIFAMTPSSSLLFCGEGVWTARFSSSKSCLIAFQVGRMNRARLCLSESNWSLWERSGFRCLKGEVRFRYYLKPHSVMTLAHVFSRMSFSSHLHVEDTSRRDSYWGRLSVKFLNYRLSLSKKLKNRLGGKILKKLILNESDSSGEVQAFRNIGFVHVVTFAGIHLYGAISVINQIWTRWGFRFLLPSRVVFFISNILLGSFFAFLWALSGFRAGFFRPLLLYGVRRFSAHRGFRLSRGRSLFAVAGVELAFIGIKGILFHDFSDYSPGRIHYVLAVWGGYLALSSKTKNVFQEHFQLSLGSWALTALYDLITTGFLALLTPLMSLLSIPFCTIVLTPLIALSFLEGNVCWDFTEFICHTFFQTLFEYLPIQDSLIFISVLQWIGVAGIILLFKKYGRRALVFLLFILMSSHSELKIVQINVGQGDAALILRSDGNADMIDVGSARALSKWDWLLLIRRYGVNGIQNLYLTHFDEDHIGGLFLLAEVIPIKGVWLPPDALADPKWTRVHRLLKEHQITIRSSESSPYSRIRFPVQKGPNGRMQGLCVTFSNGQKYLNMGDASSRQERWFLKYSPYCKDRVAVLKVNHHGSATSSSSEFLKRFKGATAWLSYGAMNRFGHPNVEVLHRLFTRGYSVHHTALEGDLLYPESIWSFLKYRSLWEALLGLFQKTKIDRTDSFTRIR